MATTAATATTITAAGATYLEWAPQKTIVTVHTAILIYFSYELALSNSQALRAPVTRACSDKPGAAHFHE